MASSKVANLAPASALDGTELFYGVQGGLDRKVTGAQISAFTATVTVSSAEIKALFTTPKTIVAAPGAGFAIEVLDYIYELKFNTTAYTVTDSVALNYAGLGATTSIDTLASQLILTATQSQFGAAVMAGKIGTTYGAYALNRSSVENKAVQLIGVTSNPTLGDGVLYVTLRYRIYAFQG